MTPRPPFARRQIDRFRTDPSSIRIDARLDHIVERLTAIDARLDEIAAWKERPGS